MNKTEVVLLIGIMAAATYLPRMIVFLVFSKGTTPKWIAYLSGVLPTAIMGFLIVYCLHSVSVFTYPYGIPEAIGVLATVLLHVWKRNTLLSISLGTVVYMIVLRMF
ncbi:MAG: AzlD domain-containing protein [Erysipelotrichaceae bacterium]|nr:AzlD domain-containing protein [Erysipelotrichaceae bacterium]